MKKPESSNNQPKSNLDLLLDLGDIMTAAPVMTPSMDDYSSQNLESPIRVVEPVSINSKSIELLNRIIGNGLSADYRFTRTPNLYSTKMVNLNITFRNSTNEDINDIKLAKKVSRSLSEYYYQQLLLLYSNLCIMWNQLSITSRSR